MSGPAKIRNVAVIVTAGREWLVEALLFQCAARASKEPSSRCPR